MRNDPVPHIGGRANCDFHVMLIPFVGDAKSLTGAYADIGLAASMGSDYAAKLFPGQVVEVVVIHTMTNEARLNLMVQP